MSDFPQIPFEAAEFAVNPEQRVPCVLLLDTSGSMQGSKIEKLNSGVEQLVRELREDAVASKRVELAVVAFGGHVKAGEFSTIDGVFPERYTASGCTPMGEAIEKAINLVEGRKSIYRSNGVPYLRPWIFLITDGEPTDSIDTAVRLVHEGEERKSFAFFSISVDGGGMVALQKISVRQPLVLKNMQFATMFTWLSASLKSSSRSIPGSVVPLTNPTGPSGWGVVD